MASSHYVHGKMDVKDQSATFSGFIKFSLWSGLLIAIGVFAAVLVFGANYTWLGAMVFGLVLGAIAGLLLKMGNAWLFTLGGIGVLSVIIALVEALIKAIA